MSVMKDKKLQIELRRNFPAVWGHLLSLPYFALIHRDNLLKFAFTEIDGCSGIAHGLKKIRLLRNEL